MFKKSIILIITLFFWVVSFSQLNGFNQSADCQYNVFCYPEFCNERRSVVLIEKWFGSYFEPNATGFLINNERGDGTPYLLTASHVFDSDRDGLLSIVELDTLLNSRIVFNYQFNECSPVNSNLEPSKSEFITGLEFVAKVEGAPGQSNGDWILLKIIEHIPNSYNHYLAGFTLENEKVNNVYSIHHPKVDVKKYSHSEKKVGDTFYTWIVKKWNLGWNEPGSSGSPLFSSERRVIGINFGNLKTPDDCTNKKLKTVSSKFYSAWFGYSSSSVNGTNNINHQLQHWLSPNSTEGVYLSAVSGLEPCRSSWNFENANDLHTSDNVNPLLDFPTNFFQYGTRTYNGVYSSSGVITAGNNVEIIPNTSVEFYGETINLKPGFKASSGSYFHAKPQPCLGGCDNGKSAVEEPEIVISNSKKPKYEDYFEDKVDDSILEEISENYINSIFPNPTSSVLNIEVSEEYFGGELKIYDILGNQVWIETIKSNRFNIDNFANLSEGVYTILFSKDGYFETQKVVKQ